MLAKAAGAVAPGGTFLLVGHDTRNLAGGYGGPKTDRVLYTPEDIVADLDGSRARDRAGRGREPAGRDARGRAHRDRRARQSFSSSSGELTLTSSRSSSSSTATSSPAIARWMASSPTLERGQRRPAVGTRERPARRARDVPAGGGELEQELRRDERAVDGKDDAELGWCGAQPGGERRRSARAPRVRRPQRERQIEPVGRPCRPRAGAPHACAERPPARAPRASRRSKPCERLRRAEAGRGAADEQDARQARHAPRLAVDVEAAAADEAAERDAAVGARARPRGSTARRRATRSGQRRRPQPSGRARTRAGRSRRACARDSGSSPPRNAQPITLSIALWRPTSSRTQSALARRRRRARSRAARPSPRRPPAPRAGGRAARRRAPRGRAGGSRSGGASTATASSAPLPQTPHDDDV